MNYENTPGHVASFFSGYSEKEFRMLSKDWLQVTFTPRSIAKHLSPYGSKNSYDHMVMLNHIGLYITNVKQWIKELFEERCLLNIHSFEIQQKVNLNAIRMTYHIPIMPFVSNIFGSNLLSIKIV